MPQCHGATIRKTSQRATRDRLSLPDIHRAVRPEQYWRVSHAQGSRECSRSIRS